MYWDVFISYASEDKDTFALPLAKALQKEGLKVWFDEFALTVGDSLHRSIEKGLESSKYGIVILSPNFFAKEWPKKELDGLFSRELSGGKIILPIWHNITAEQITGYSPILADRLAANSNRGVKNVVTELLRAIAKPTSEIITPPKSLIATPGGKRINEKRWKWWEIIKRWKWWEIIKRWKWEKIIIIFFTILSGLAAVLALPQIQHLLNGIISITGGGIKYPPKTIPN